MQASALFYSCFYTLCDGKICAFVSVLPDLKAGDLTIHLFGFKGIALQNCA